MTYSERLNRGLVVQSAACSTTSIARINSAVLIGISILEFVPQSSVSATDARVLCEPRFTF